MRGCSPGDAERRPGVRDGLTSDRPDYRDRTHGKGDRVSRWEPKSAEVPLFLHIAAGVFLGIVAAAAVIWSVSLWQAEFAAQEALRALQRRAAAEASEVQRAREAARRADAIKLEQVEQQRQALDQARRAAQSEAARREEAWQKFYRKPATCDEARGGVWSVDCANEYIRATARFAELYDAGKL